MALMTEIDSGTISVRIGEPFTLRELAGPWSWMSIRYYWFVYDELTACDSPDIARACWGCVRVVTTGSRHVVTTLSVGAAGCGRAPPRLQHGSMSAVARKSQPCCGRQRTQGCSARLGQGMSARPTSDAYLRALRPPGCRRSDRLGRPPKWAGRCGDGHQAG